MVLVTEYCHSPMWGAGVERAVRVEFPCVRVWVDVGWVVRLPTKQIGVVGIGDFIQNPAFMIESCMGGCEGFATFTALVA